MDRTAARAEKALYAIQEVYRRPDFDRDSLPTVRALLDILEVEALGFAEERRLRNRRNAERAATEPERARTPLIAA